MKRQKAYYVGAALAFMLAAVFLNIQAIEAVSKSLAMTSLPDELRMALDLGIIDRSDLGTRSLNSPIKHREFAVLLKNTLQLLGASAGSSMADLRESGILASVRGKQSISRRHALEAMCRMVMYLNDTNFLAMDPAASGNFSDYDPPEKYINALGYLKGAWIVRGYGNGVFGARRALSKKEAAFMVYRLYEHVSSTLMNKSKGEHISFIDLPTDHLAMKGIKTVAKAGAFDLIKMRPSFDGNRVIPVRDAGNLIKGLLKKAEIPEADQKVNVVVNGRDLRSAVDRSLLAQLLEVLVKEGKARSDDYTDLAPYMDVPAGSAPALALEALGKRGIVMGYPGGLFRGGDRVSWFEAVGTLDAVARTLILGKNVPEETPEEDSHLATRDEFEQFIATLKAKRARVRNILSTNPLTPDQAKKLAAITAIGAPASTSELPAAPEPAPEPAKDPIQAPASEPGIESVSEPMKELPLETVLEPVPLPVSE
jgi:hypothetical protein